MGYKFSNTEAFLELNGSGIKSIKLQMFKALEFSRIVYEDFSANFYEQHNEIVEPYVREELGVPKFKLIEMEPLNFKVDFEVSFECPPLVYICTRYLRDEKEAYESGICIQEKNLRRTCWILPSAYPGFISFHGDYASPIYSATEVPINEYILLPVID